MIKGSEKVYDCLHRERFRYALSSRVDERLLAHYPEAEGYRVTLYDARHLLPRARVTFQIHPKDGRFMINGALGLDYVTITYLRDERAAATRAAQEAVLAALP